MIIGFQDFIIDQSLISLWYNTHRYRLASLRSTGPEHLAQPGSGWRWTLSANTLDCIRTGQQSQQRTQTRSSCRTEALELSCTDCRWSEEQLRWRCEDGLMLNFNYWVLVRKGWEGNEGYLGKRSESLWLTDHSWHWTAAWSDWKLPVAVSPL